MMPPWLAQVHPKTGTPINATIVMLAATAIIGFFTDLGILADLLSISTLFIFLLVALALIVRRYYVSGETSVADRNKLIVCIVLILVSSIATAIYWGVSDNNDWIAYVITVPIWISATVGISVFIPQARKPKVWGVPLVPWLPSLSIGINIFLLGSINGASFKRFGMWTGVLLLYYFFFGLHASYDTAKESGENKIGDGWRKVEEGQSVSTATTATATATGVSSEEAK